MANRRRRNDRGGKGYKVSRGAQERKKIDEETEEREEEEELKSRSRWKKREGLKSLSLRLFFPIKLDK